MSSKNTKHARLKAMQNNFDYFFIGDQSDNTWIS